MYQLLNEEAEFVIGDPTEIERPGAKKTGYVGTLSDGKTKGFWMLTLATSLRGRAMQAIRERIGERTLILDREFSYLNFFLALTEEDVNYVIRLNQGSKAPKFYFDEDKERELKLRTQVYGCF